MKQLFALFFSLLPLTTFADEIQATLLHTASTHYGSVLTDASVGNNTIDNPTGKEYFNNDQTSGWGAQAFAHFSFDIPEGYVVMSAVLTWSYYQNNASARTTQIWYLKEGTMLNYSTDGEGSSLMNTNYDEKNGGINHRYPSSRTQICVTKEMSGKADHRNIQTDVTEALRTIGHQGYIIFQWTGNAGGGWLYGSQSQWKPELTIIAEKAHVGDGITMMPGGQFMDRIMAMPDMENVEKPGWGDVKPRYTANGIENDHISFWGGNVQKGADGKYHINVAGWNSDSRAHSYWANSDVYHAVSDNLYGPYTLANKPVSTGIIGKGHNPETYLTDDGTYVCYVIMGNVTPERLTSKSLNGSWTRSAFETDARDRSILAGYSNYTFTKRADGSFVVIDRGGSVWISRDGLDDPYHQITDATVYNGDKRYFEDPLIWKDPLQYHMIVNDWNAKQAFYSRSADGIHWVTEQGFAYKPGCVYHSDGTVEEWYKLERPKIYLGEDGYAEMINLAVIDVEKGQDLAGDSHSSKNVMMPLNKGIVMEVTSAKDATVWTVLLKDTSLEKINTASLVFGNYAKVNYGFGMHCTSAEQQGNDLLLTFEGNDHGIDNTEFAPKMLGEDNEGNMIYGYARLPWFEYDAPIVSARCPLVYDKKVTRVVIENYGMTASAPTTFTVKDNKGVLVARGTVECLPAYGSQSVSVEQVADISSTATGFVVTFADGETNTFACDMTDTDAPNAIKSADSPQAHNTPMSAKTYSIDGKVMGNSALGLVVTDGKKIVRNTLHKD